MTDNKSDQVSPSDYPWYRMVEDGSIEQGDLLFNFPTVSIVSEYEQIRQDEIEFDISYFDVVVLTQSCDLAAGKVENVLLCPFFEKGSLVEKFRELGKSDGEKQVQRGKWESLYLLPPCDVGSVDMAPRIVNFRQILAIPFHVVESHIKSQEHRARLCPPYREHLAQAFARFIMRIGFPIDFRL